MRRTAFGFLVQVIEFDPESLNPIFVSVNLSMRFSKSTTASAPQELHGTDGLSCNQIFNLILQKRSSTLYQGNAEPTTSTFIGADVVALCCKNLSGPADRAFADSLLGMDILTLCGPLLLVIHSKGWSNFAILENQSGRVFMPIFGGQLFHLCRFPIQHELHICLCQIDAPCLAPDNEGAGIFVSLVLGTAEICL